MNWKIRDIKLWLTLVFTVALFLNSDTLFSQGDFYIKIKDSNIYTVDSFKARLLKDLTSDNAILKISAPFYASGQSIRSIFRLKIAENPTEDIVKKLAENPLTEYIEPVPVKSFFVNPNDLGLQTGTGNQWYLYQINAPQAWQISQGQPSIVVAIVDNAVAIDHPDLVNQVFINTNEIPNDGIDNDLNGYIDDYQGFDIANNDFNVRPDNNLMYHGTHVSGLAGAQTNNGIGIASVGYGVKILPVKISQADNTPAFGYEGIVYAADMGADIINCSWGSTTGSQAEQDIINYAVSKNCIIVAAAGNDNSENPTFPASLNNVIAVAATSGVSDSRLFSSNYGYWIDVCAPGGNILSTDYDTISQSYSYKQRNGTSMAAPLVSGTLALMKSFYPSATNDQLTGCLLNSSQIIDNLPVNAGMSGKLGSGRINVAAALNCLSAYKPAEIILSQTSQHWCLPAKVPLEVSLLNGSPDSIRWYISGAVQPYMYGLKTFFEFDSVGMYDIQIISFSNGGQINDTLFYPAYLQISSSGIRPNIYYSNNTLQTVQSYDQYMWYADSTFLSNNSTIAPSIPGNYYVYTTNAGECTNISDTIPSYLFSIEPYDAESISVYPIPASDKLYIRGKNTLKSLTILGISGVPLNRQSQTEYIDLSYLPSGVYILEIERIQGDKLHKKFIKR